MTVNCVAPGFIESAMTGKLNDKQKDAIMGAIPMKRMGTGGEVASAVAYLASNEAAYVTGQTIHVQRRHGDDLIAWCRPSKACAATFLRQSRTWGSNTGNCMLTKPFPAIFGLCGRLKPC